MGDGKQKSNLRSLKVTAVGDGMVGKTCMLLTYKTQEFPKTYAATVFDNFPDTVTVDQVEYDVTLWDTAGQEDYERLRPLSYKNTDCFILCFAVDSRASYNNIMSKWSPELKNYCPNVPIILVATKTDLRDEENSAGTISPKEGKKAQRKIGAIKYMECSARYQQGLNDIIHESVRACVKNKKKRTTSKRSNWCCFSCCTSCCS